MNKPIYKVDKTITWKIEDEIPVKTRLAIYDPSDEKGSLRETPWSIRKDGKEVLVNHALIFTPYHSWGAIISDDMDKSNMWKFCEEQEQPLIMLHPEAWDAMLEQGIIDGEGNHLL